MNRNLGIRNASEEGSFEYFVYFSRPKYNAIVHRFYYYFIVYSNFFTYYMGCVDLA